MIVPCDQNGINLASTTIKNGGLVVFPTDTVYGLGCDPRNARAVERIFRIKKRMETKALPVLGYSKEEISKITIFDELSSRIADKFWPGQVTLVLKLIDNEIKKAMNQNDKIAVRVPNHPCALALLKEIKLIVGTSANFSGLPAFSDSKKAQENFSGYDLFLDGGTILNSTSSTIIEVKNGTFEILRQGKVTREEITNSL
ncbi:MAG TPA: L-threonylcarbamoyladenylate synthase [Nitrosopumilaceae archaeon]|nr:L-threonylcarbamoyladenylate synthase [Nitrosopumilaceae archaeon]